MACPYTLLFSPGIILEDSPYHVSMCFDQDFLGIYYIVTFVSLHFHTHFFSIVSYTNLTFEGYVISNDTIIHISQIQRRPSSLLM